MTNVPHKTTIMKKMNPEELKSMMLEGALSERWEQRETEYTIDDVDVASLKAFFEKATACGRLPSDSFDAERLLNKLGLIKKPAS